MVAVTTVAFLDVDVCGFGPGNTFQKRRVSSPAPVTIVWPSGDIARYNTRSVWPVSVASLLIVGYFHTMI